MLPSQAAQESFEWITAANSQSGFLAAEDFDGTGILAGIDLCASSYWWIPEMYATGEGIDAAFPATLQATQRTDLRSASTSPSTSAANAA